MGTFSSAEFDFHFLPGDKMGTRPLHVLRGQEFAHALTCFFFGREGGI